MDEAQTKHIVGIIDDFRDKAFSKYMAGASEHGGNIWDIPILKLLEEAQNEHIDGYVYTKTIQELLEFLLSDPIIKERVTKLLEA